MQAPGALVTLKRWFWHLTRLDILAAALPTLSHLRFGPLYCHSHLTDKALTAALQLNPPLTLSVPGISLDSDHSSTPWPWRDMIVHTLDVTALLKMPRPSGVGDGGCPVIRVEKLDFTGVKQVSACNAYVLLVFACLCAAYLAFARALCSSFGA